MTGNDPRHGLIAVAHKHLLAVPNELNMGAEVRFRSLISTVLMSRLLRM
jgi:hypothetical protein